MRDEVITCRSHVLHVLHVYVKLTSTCPIHVTQWLVEDVGVESVAPGSHPLGWLIAAEHMRADRDTGITSTGWGRRWFVEHGSTESALVKTALMAVLALAEHEVREGFRYRGALPFDPHRTVSEMSVVGHDQ